MIATFASGPVAAGEFGESSGAAFFAGVTADIEGDCGFFGVFAGTGAANDGEASRSGESRLDRLDGIDRYRALIESTVGGIWFLDMGKKGGVAASSEAVLWA